MKRSILAAAALVATMTAHASSVDPQRAELEHLLYQTVGCMQDGAASFMRLGLTEQDDIASRLTQLCGVPLGRFMVQHMGFTPDGAANYAFQMGRAAVRDASAR